MLPKRKAAQEHSWNAADTVTSVRIAVSLFLLPFPLYSARFFAAYTMAGLTDALDGWLARRTGTASEFGARLDSIADLLFYGVLLFRYLPVLWERLPGAVWYAVTAILVVRLAAYATAAVKYRRFAALHTRLNKLTGIGIFLLPYVLAFSTGIFYSGMVCVLAFAAALEELMIHLRRKEYNAD